MDTRKIGIDTRLRPEYINTRMMINPGTALNELRELCLHTKRRQYPNVPVSALSCEKFSDKTANGLTKCILAFLKLHGHKAWRQSSEGRYRPGKVFTDVLGHRKQMKGTYIKGTNVGHGDVSSIINGRFVSWEVKLKSDRQRDEQKQFQKEVEQSGGLYFMVATYEQFLTIYKDKFPARVEDSMSLRV